MANADSTIFSRGELAFSFTQQAYEVNLEAIEIASARLKIRPIKLSDAEDVFREFNYEVSEHMTPQPATSIDETIGFIKAALDGIKNRTDLQLVIESAESAEFLGLIGVHTRFGVSQPEIGLWLKKSAHLNGFGREAVYAVKQWADRNLKYDVLVYPVSAANISSRKIPESFGVEALPGAKIVQRPNRTALTIVTYKIPRDAVALKKI